MSVAGMPTAADRMRGHQIADLMMGLMAGLEPGHRLGTKAELRDHFDVALATVNEALRILQAQGRVTVRTGPGGGVFVAEPHPLVRIGDALISVRGDPGSIADALAMRTALDPLCLLEAARYRNQADLADLRRCLDDLRGAIASELEFGRAIWALHRRIAAIGRNTLLREVSLALLDLLEAGTESVVPGSKPPAYRRKRLAAHEALVDAIESGDEAQCARASRKHAEGHDR